MRLLLILSVLMPACAARSAVVTSYVSHATCEVRFDARVFTMGAVRDPGAYPLMPRPLLGAVVQRAGGSTDIGDRSRVQIVRCTGGLRTNLVVDLGSIETGRAQDVPLGPGDLVVVPYRDM